MSRITTLNTRSPLSPQPDSATEVSDWVDDMHDPATLVLSSDVSTISVHESVVFSTTFKVPAFYFSAFGEGNSDSSTIIKR